ncbi:histidine phosphatase family protein [Pseudomonas aeruginosa]|uniref:histidine phosphatase family protein n=1 Tax=Pseudomonas aeruginosa TaxID=287 RepID=UPI0037481784|nr:histidine phosphatase family protein [Pseudomonas aeruginosa]HBP6060990.1 histidine phosphatase family protein [Pseudomonas aeruginosa]HBP6170180.1 histidine phosphatase family protein [Pseudomonas aeruginosa]HBP6483615.1 histidine phosphatase family protein [Pseudomonas aeruginosa]
MTRIILTRHGHVDWIAPERFRGRAELPLSDLGKRQVLAVAQRIAETWQPEAIYTSPLSRCVDTGAAIARATGATTQALDGLADTDYGQWQGLTHEEVRQRWPDEHRTWLEAPDLAAIPDGESLADVLARGTKVLREVLHRHAGKTLVLVGHDSINRVLLLQALGLPLSRYWRLKQEPCCLNEIAVEGTVFTLHRLNESGHLAGV